MKFFAYVIIGIIVSSCGNETGNTAAELQSQKAPAVAKEFLVEMSLAPAPEGSCPNGGVVQHYYYDLNGNGQMDSGENSGLLPAVDCYEEMIPKSNTCKNSLRKCMIPELGVAKKIDSCETADPDQLASINQTLAINEIVTSPSEAAASGDSCKKFISVNADFAFAFHLASGKSGPAKVGDYSIISMIKSVEQIIVNGATNVTLKNLKNLASIKQSPRIKVQLVLDSIDLGNVSSFDFLPVAGAEQVQILHSNFPDLKGLSKWSYQSKSPITEIWESTIMRTTGPHR